MKKKKVPIIYYPYMINGKVLKSYQPKHENKIISFIKDCIKLIKGESIL